MPSQRCPETVGLPSLKEDLQLRLAAACTEPLYEFGGAGQYRIAVRTELPVFSRG
jgi:hypothetical protein